MRYWYIVYQSKDGGFGNFCAIRDDDFNIVEAHKSAEIAANSFAVIMNWKEIPKSEYYEYCAFMKRIHHTDGESVQ